MSEHVVVQNFSQSHFTVNKLVAVVGIILVIVLLQDNYIYIYLKNTFHLWSPHLGLTYFYSIPQWRGTFSYMYHRWSSSTFIQHKNLYLTASSGVCFFWSITALPYSILYSFIAIL